MNVLSNGSLNQDVSTRLISTEFAPLSSGSHPYHIKIKHQVSNLKSRRTKILDMQVHCRKNGESVGINAWTRNL